MSKKLSGIQFSSRVCGDTKPPCQIPGISEQERRQKESEVFDRAIDDLCSTHGQILHLMDFQSHQFTLNVLVKVQHTMIMVMFVHF